MEYLFRLPTVVPPGRCLVHNQVRPARRLGTRGFRAWTQTAPDGLELCPCEWAPELGPHYRVAVLGKPRGQGAAP
jgi:hypothetical protein